MTHYRGMESESCQALRAVVGNRDAGYFFQRAVRFGGVAHQFRGIPVNLVQIGAIRRDPIVAGAAADVATKRPEGAIAPDIRARRILRDSDLEAVDMEGTEVAVPENRSVQESVIRGDGQPAKFSDLASPCVDRYDLADANSAIFVNVRHRDSVADSVSDEEGIRPVVQESDVERRTAPSVLERGIAERAVCIHAEYNDAVRIWRIRSYGPWLAVWTRHPENG